MFLDNKYTRIYYQIVTRAQHRTLDGYKEKHHIIPKSFGGSNTKENLVELTAREHFICHWLLVKMMINGVHRGKMSYALWMLSNGCTSKVHQRVKITGRKYELIRQHFASTEVTAETKAKRMTTRKIRGTKCSAETKEKLSKKFKGRDLGDEWRAKLRGRIVSDETKEKIRALNKAGIIGMKGPHTEETKKKIGDANRGKKHSPEFCEQLSKRMKGKKPSPLTIQKLRESNLGKKPSQETIDKRVATRKENAKDKPKFEHKEETKKKIGDSLRGKKQTKKKSLSAEHKANLSIAMKGKKKKPKPFDPIANKKISEALKGRPRSPETIAKIKETKRLKKLAAQNDVQKKKMDV